MRGFRLNQKTETQPAVGHVQSPHLVGQRANFDVALYQLAIASQRRPITVLHARTFRVESAVELTHVAALGPQFVLITSSCHVPPKFRRSHLDQRLCGMTGALPQAPMGVIR